MDVEELRRVEGFDMLGDERLEELALRAEELRLEPGEYLFRQGEPADTVFVLLDGDLETFVTSDGRDMMTTAHHRLKTLIGVVSALTGEPFLASTRALAPSRVAAIAAADFRRATRQETRFEQSVLQLFGPVYQRMEAELRQAEKLAALGGLAAGLAHELNNPASAAQRSAADLGGRVRELQDGLARLGELGVEAGELRSLAALAAEARGAERAPAAVSALEASDREEELAGWLRRRGVADPWELAPTLVAAGLDEAWLERVAAATGEERLAPALAWIAAGLAASTLVVELEDATGRISRLVQAVKEYSYMDRAPEQEIDVHEGIEQTLTMLGHKLKEGTVGVRRDYEVELPRITAYASELNQVWTNLLDNAIAAVDGSGTITVRTRRREDGVLVEIVDDGPGIPADIQSRVFEPFFTTKEVGQGTGLGLEIAYRIVVDHHRGDIQVESRPGETRFAVRLPVDGARRSSP
jgi:signal transduction histidine kinase